MRRVGISCWVGGWLVLCCAALAGAGEGSEVAGPRSDLAAMIQKVVLATRISLGVRESAPTHVLIDRVNGRGVCEAAARRDVERLQSAFESQPGIYRNIGPALVRVTDRTGNKSSFDREISDAGSRARECSGLYVSVHE